MSGEERGVHEERSAEEGRLRERREYARVSGQLSVALRTAAEERGRMIPAVLTSLSLGGARVRCSVPVELGTDVVLDMPIPSLVDPASASARVIGHATCDDPAQYELCLEFTELAPADLRKIADFISARLERERDNQQTVQMRLELLQDLSQVFHATTDMGRITTAVVDIAMEFTGAESGALLLLDGGGERLRTRVARGPASDQALGIVLEAGEGAAGWVAAHGTSLKLDRADEDEAMARETAGQIGATARALAAVPLRIKEQCIGVLEVMNGPERPPFTTTTLRMLEALASQAAIIIENARLCAQLEQVARDSRSGLVSATAEAEWWQRAAEAHLDSAAVVYLLDPPRLLLSEAAKRLFEAMGPDGKPLMLGLLQTLESTAQAGGRTTTTRLLAAEEGSESALIAHMSWLSSEEGEPWALLAQLVDIRAR